MPSPRNPFIYCLPQAAFLESLALEVGAPWLSYTHSPWVVPCHMYPGISNPNVTCLLGLPEGRHRYGKSSPNFKVWGEKTQ